MKTLEEYIALYERKTGEKFHKQSDNVFFYNPEHGFCEFKLGNTALFIGQMCGDLQYWLDRAFKICEAQHINAISSYICRHHIPYIRHLGFEIVDNDGGVITARHKKTGEKLLSEPVGKGNIFTWYLDRRR